MIDFNFNNHNYVKKLYSVFKKKISLEYTIMDFIFNHYHNDNNLNYIRNELEISLEF